MLGLQSSRSDATANQQSGWTRASSATFIYQHEGKNHSGSKAKTKSDPNIVRVSVQTFSLDTKHTVAAYFSRHTVAAYFSRDSP